MENKEKEKEIKEEKNIFSMKDEDFEELKNYKHYTRKTTEVKINNTTQKYPRNANSRLRSTEKSFIDTRSGDSVNKKFFRAQSSGIKFFQVKNKLSESTLMKNTNNKSDKKMYNISTVDKTKKK